MKPIIVGLIGKPLSGKDTQADALIAHHPEAVKISTGHIIRGVAEEGETHRFWPILGPYIPMMEAGIKLPDEPILAILGLVIEEQIQSGKEMLVIAGSPRSNEQLAGFDTIAEKTGARSVNILLDASDEVTYYRSANRNEGRVDDTPEIHAVRLTEYDTHVVPMVNRLGEQGRLTVVDAEQPIETITKEIEKHLNLHRDPEISLPVMARR